MPQFYVGLDLGQAQDFTVLAVLEKVLPPVGQGYENEYYVRHLERFRLGTTYPVIVRRVVELMAMTPLRGNASLVVDQTGVGQAVVDLLQSAGLDLVAVMITAGERAERVPGGWRVPKRDLVSVLQVLLQSGRLKVAEDLPEASSLVKELLSFQVRITAGAHDIYGTWREGAHDDLVLATALACWLAKHESNGTGWTTWFASQIVR